MQASHSCNNVDLPVNRSLKRIMVTGIITYKGNHLYEKNIKNGMDGV
jgi:hypothetical protein